jgi:arylsulfatase A-like enzyme
MPFVRTFGISLAGLSLSAAAVTLQAGSEHAPPADTAASRPNLLLVTFDTTRADRLTPYGYRDARMPALERLAREGVVFTRCYAPTVQTLPSHAAMMTGLYPITSNVVSNGQRLDDEVLTLAELLRAEGYRTGAIVATAPLMEVFGLAQGFENYDDDFEEWAGIRMAKSLLRLFSVNRWNVRTTRPAHRVASLARDWLSDASREDRPFFLWLHFIEPHDPYVGHPDLSRPGRVVSGGTLNAFGVKEANYVNEIEFADHYLGNVLQQLDALGLTNRTLTIFTADHGESLGEDDYRGHREEVYEQIIHVPLIVRMPGRVPAGARLETPAQLVDVTPTALPLLGFSLKGSPFQGKDLFALKPDRPRSLFAMAAKLFTRDPIRIAMIREGKKFVTWPETGRQALYDLEKDPGESRNLLVEDHKGATGRSSRDWAAEVRAWWAKNDRLRADDFTLDAESLERLKSLGYIRR